MPDLFNGTIGCFVHDNYILNIQGAGRTRQKAMERLKATEFSIRDDMTCLLYTSPSPRD